MCFDRDALPPDPARSGMLAGSETTILVADDGNHVAATIARTLEPAAGVVIIPDVRGLHRYYERLAEHLADAGVHAIAIDPYGRTAGAEHRDDDFDYGPHRAAVRDDGPEGRRPSRRRAPTGATEPRGLSRWGSASAAGRR